MSFITQFKRLGWWISKSFNIHCQTTWGFFYVKKDVRIKYTSSNFCLHLHHREYVSLGKKVCKKKVSGKVKEVKNLETFYCNWYVEKMTKKFTLQDDEKFCIFVTKDKRQTIIFTMSYIKYLQVFKEKVVWDFLSFIVVFLLF